MCPPRKAIPELEVDEFEVSACVSLVRELGSIVRGLWVDFEDVSITRDYAEIFVEILGPLRAALGAEIVFLAQLVKPKSAPRTKKCFKIVKWLTARRQNLHTEIVPPPLRRGFDSEILAKASELSSGVAIYGGQAFRGTEKGQLSRLLRNLAVVRLWFEPNVILFLGVSMPDRGTNSFHWTGSQRRILETIPELIAGPLRAENDRRNRILFEEICLTGSPDDVRQCGRRILEPRVQLAWHAKDVRVAAIKPTKSACDTELPTLGGDYDLVLAYYLDSQRYLAGLNSRATAAEVIDPALQTFARQLSPGESPIRLYASEAVERDVSFTLGNKAILASHAVARALLWMAYRNDFVSLDQSREVKCSLAGCLHPVCDGLQPRCLQFVAKVLQRIPRAHIEYIGLACARASWLRTSWLGMYYRSKHLLETPEAHTQHLQRLSVDYRQLAQTTGQFFRGTLAALQKHDKELRIDWRWLFIWFLSNAMGCPQFSKRFGRYEKARSGLKGHLDHYIDASITTLFGLHLLRFWQARTVPPFWDIPELRPHRLAQARIRLLAEYAHRQLRVHSNWRLRQQLESQFRPEVLLYASSASHRDHTFHVIDVCLLGHLLISAAFTGRQGAALRKAVSGNIPSKKRDHILRQWYPAALLHDVGCSIGVVEKVANVLEKFDTPDLQKYCKNIISSIGTARQQLNKAIHAELKSAGLSLPEDTAELTSDHGALGTDHLIHELRRLRDGDQFLRRPMTKAILQAILNHSSHDAEFKSSERLAFLLVLCDHLQEWGRARVRPEHMARALLSSFQMEIPAELGAEQAATYMVPTAVYKPRSNTIAFNPCAPTFNLYYSRSRSSLIEPACQWVDVWDDFERIVCVSAFPIIRIRFIHPQSEILQKMKRPPSEMQLLRDFAETDEGAFLGEWLSELDRGGRSRRIEYCISDESTEEFTVYVGRPKRRGGRLLREMPKSFYSEFVEWKERRLRFAEGYRDGA